MAIYRGHLPSDNYTMIATAWLQDSRISWTAQGLLIEASTFPRGAVIDPDDLVMSGRGEEAEIRSAVRELEDIGYLIRGTDRKLRLTDQIAVG